MSKLNTKRELSCDFCVIGGGAAGTYAALAAGRNGLKVILVQDRAVLGGNSSSEVKMHVVGADCHGQRKGARESGLIEEMRLEDAYRNPYRCYTQWDLLLYEKIKENPNITLLLQSVCDSAEVETTSTGKRIKTVHVTRSVTEDEFIITAKFFADCSGDGRLGAEAGAHYIMGREAKSEYNEKFAIEKADHQTLGNSILFTAHKMEKPQPFHPPSWIRKFTKDQLKLRGIDSYEYGYWWSEWGGQLNTIKDIEDIRHELLRIALGVWDYIKNSGEHPHSANWVLDWVGTIPGKRESRRFYGDYVIVEQDVSEGKVFEDQVAYGGWSIDLHPPSGIDAVNEAPTHQIATKNLYSIPLKSLYSRNIENLFFAGRNMSASHVAFASTRVMATCSVMGQGIGTAASVLVKKLKKDESIQALSSDAATIHEIQQLLLKNDAFLLGVKNSDPKDLCLSGTCKASTTKDDAVASNVINGVTRLLHSEFGSWSSNSKNYWESTALPAWVEIDLEDSKLLREIHFTFDTGIAKAMKSEGHVLTALKQLMHSL